MILLILSLQIGLYWYFPFTKFPNASFSKYFFTFLNEKRVFNIFFFKYNFSLFVKEFYLFDYLLFKISLIASFLLFNLEIYVT